MLKKTCRKHLSSLSSVRYVKWSGWNIEQIEHLTYFIWTDFQKLFSFSRWVSLHLRTCSVWLGRPVWQLMRSRSRFHFFVSRATKLLKYSHFQQPSAWSSIFSISSSTGLGFCLLLLPNSVVYIFIHRVLYWWYRKVQKTHKLWVSGNNWKG